MYLAVPFSHLDEFRIDLELANVETRGGLLPRAVLFTKDLLHSRHELARVDRGAHIVICTELDAHDAVHRVLIPQEGHSRDPRPLDFTDELKPPLIRQAVIYDRDLEALSSSHLPGLSSSTSGD